VLSLLTFLPLVGAAIIMFVRGDDAVVAPQRAVDRALDQPRSFVLSLILWARFDRGTAEFQFVERVSWLPESESATTWAWTASRCCSSCSPPR
jgi:NADH-quinone oxidoreductase subunit M